MLRPSLVHDTGGDIVPVAAFREPHRPLCQAGDRVRRLAYRGGEDVVAEHEFLGPDVCLVVFRPVVVQRPAYGDAGVVCLPCRGVDVRGEVVPEPYGSTHGVEVVREYPEPLFHGHVLGGVGLVYRCEHPGLEPARIKLGIGAVHSGRLLVPAYVMSPVAVAYIRCGGREVREIPEHLPCREGVPGEAYLVAVAAYAAPAVVDHRSRGIDALGFGLAYLVMKEGIVEPERIAEPRSVVAVLPLLPVEPPEVDPHVFQGPYYGIEIGVRPLYLVYPERDRDLAAVLPEISFRTVIVRCAGQIVFHKPVVRLLVGLYAVAEMQVQGGLYVHPVQFFQEIPGIRKKFLFPGISRPADGLPEFVQARPSSRLPRRGGGLEFGPGLMPVHVYDHDIYRDVEVLEVPGQVYELEIRVLPVAAPPVAECVFRRERYLSGDFREVPEGGLVVMPVAEEIEVLPVCAVPALHPVLPVAVHRDEHVPAALVYHGPAVLRDYARVVRVDDGLSVAPVQGPGSTEEIPGGVCPGIPFHPLLSVPSRPERDGKVVSGEFSVPAVFQCEVFCLYCDEAGGFPYVEFRYLELPVHYPESGPVFEPGVGGPFHPYQSRCKDGESRVAVYNTGSWGCYRVILCRLRCLG